MRHTESPLDNPDVAHEHSDINVRALVRFTVALFIVTVIVHILMWGMFRLLESRAARNDAALSPVARPTTEMPANTVANPIFGAKQATPLLTNEPSVLRQHRSQEAEALGNYGWVDEKSGVARIPIEEAKKLILQRGDSLAGRLLLFDALGTTLDEVTVRRNPECPVCGDHPSITEYVDYVEFCNSPVRL